MGKITLILLVLLSACTVEPPAPAPIGDHRKTWCRLSGGEWRETAEEIDRMSETTLQRFVAHNEQYDKWCRGGRNGNKSPAPNI